MGVLGLPCFSVSSTGSLLDFHSHAIQPIAIHFSHFGKQRDDTILTIAGSSQGGNSWEAVKDHTDLYAIRWKLVTND